MFRTLVLSFILLVLSSSLRAGEGMWLPLLLSGLNEEEMQAMGMKMTAEDIYSVNQGSLKDAIVSFGGFCTGEIVSRDGLILTNHHCGYGAIQSHSTLERNLLRDGFWAMSREEELANPGLFVRFIVRIEDVTDAALQDVDPAIKPEARQSQIDQNINGIISKTERESYQDAMVRPFFEGNQYFLFVTETYRDVRLVGAPPESIGKFGADTDNWEWPRHTGDFSMFRVYAGPDNTPAEYSPDNVPLQPRHTLPVSLGGVKEGDFTLVFGFPGTTHEYLPSYGVTQFIDIVAPSRVSMRNISLAIMDKEMRKDEATRLRLAPRYASLSNSWKRWIGQRAGLTKVNAVGKKQDLEAEFTERIRKKGKLKKAYGELLPQFEELYTKTGPLEKARAYYSEIFGINVQLFQLVSRLDRLRNAYEKNGEEAYQSAVSGQKSWFDSFYNRFDSSIDREICHALLSYMSSSLDKPFLPSELLPEDMFMRRVTFASMIEGMYSPELTSSTGLEGLLQMDGASFMATLGAQPAYQLYTSVQIKTNTEISPAYNEYSTTIHELQRKWMAAQMEVFPEKRFWPDANSTMRVTYGLVEGSEPRDGIRYQPVTYLDGVMEKYKPGDYEFDVSPRLIELYKTKDYGRYADRSNGKLPVCFLGSNHTTGGNSGSPVIDASGNLIGINFDRTWESTMSDYYYDVSICRNIMVDIRYVLFVIDKFAGAGHLVQEMELVNPN